MNIKPPHLKAHMGREANLIEQTSEEFNSLFNWQQINT
jgi:hypothetical protein